ncbi:18066_t:CDS:1, partial [Acaulospora morrowiae]
MTQEKVNGIGWHMVKQVTYSADTILRLTNIESQYIIDQVTSVQVAMTVSKTVNTVHNQESKSTENEINISINVSDTKFPSISEIEASVLDTEASPKTTQWKSSEGT